MASYLCEVFLMTTDWNATSISCGKTWNFKWEWMPLFRIPMPKCGVLENKFQELLADLGTSWFENIHLRILYDDDLNVWYNMDQPVSFSFPLCGEPKFYYHFNEKTFFLELNETQLFFFSLSLYRWTLWWLLAGRWFEN